jgi:RNA polymerase sigma-32 factor
MVAVAKQLEQGREGVNGAAIRQVRPQQVEDLVRRWRDRHDSRARDALLAMHMPLVHWVSSKYPARLGKEDIVQEAQLGFLRALESFDPDRGVTLATYARYWIRAYVHRYLLRTWSIVPRFTTHEKRRVFFGANRARLALGIEEDDERAVRRIARRLRVRPEVVAEVEHGRQLRDEGLETHSEDPRDRFATEWPGPEAQTDASERARLLRERLPAALGALDERERMIFLARFDPDEAIPLEVLGRRLGITRERARQLESRARRKLAVSFSDLVEEDVAAVARVAPPPRRRRARSVAGMA